jgi:hypothetical protein
LKRTAARIRENLRAFDGSVRLLTITAPGKVEWPWGERAELDAVRWNCDMWSHWKALRKAASVDAGRASKGQRSGLLVFVPELQKRGFLHLHVVLGAETPLQRRWAEAFVRYCRQNGARYGFGRVDFDAKRGWTAARESLGGYLSKLGGYVSKLGGVRELWEDADKTGQLPARCFYVSRRLTSRTGLTMRASRLRSRWRRATGQWLTLAQLRDLVELLESGWVPFPLRV